MNTDQLKGTVKEAAGKVQQKAGAAIGSGRQQAKGLGKQIEGSLQKTAGDARESAKKHTKDH